MQKNNYSSNLKAPLSDVILRVRENCENTTIINFINLHSWEKCDFIGFSLISEQQLPYAMLFAQKIREKVPYAKFIAGGPYITEIFPNLVNTDLIFDFFDYLVVHEGETAILNIINHEKDKYPLFHPNIFSLKKKDNIKGPFLLKDVQVFNEQDFSSLNLDYYKIWEERGLPVYSSKGCTWCKCSFCSQNNILKYREMEVSYFIDKICQILHETGITCFQISDEDIRPSRLKEMAEEIMALRHSLWIR